MQEFYRRWIPITLRAGFLQVDLRTAADALVDWRRGHVRAFEAQWLDCHISEAFPRLAPFTIPPRRSLLVETDSEWTAYFDNGARGPDPVGPIGYLAESIGCRGLIATCVPHTLDQERGRARGMYGAVQFELFGQETNSLLGCERALSVSYDGGKWRFDESGIPQSFEDVEQYRSRRIVDRFTPEKLVDYCLALGVRVFEETYYGRTAYLFSVLDPLPSGCPSLLLDEARFGLGI